MHKDRDHGRFKWKTSIELDRKCMEFLEQFRNRSKILRIAIRKYKRYLERKKEMKKREEED
jgi:metal-responsive CopG/Arc/MetJ family transcriptional regulator